MRSIFPRLFSALAVAGILAATPFLEAEGAPSAPVPLRADGALTVREMAERPLTATYDTTDKKGAFGMRMRLSYPAAWPEAEEPRPGAVSTRIYISETDSVLLTVFMSTVGIAGREITEEDREHALKKVTPAMVRKDGAEIVSEKRLFVDGVDSSLIETKTKRHRSMIAMIPTDSLLVSVQIGYKLNQQNATEEELEKAYNEARPLFTRIIGSIKIAPESRPRYVRYAEPGAIVPGRAEPPVAVPQPPETQEFDLKTAPSGWSTRVKFFPPKAWEKDQHGERGAASYVYRKDDVHFVANLGVVPRENIGRTLNDVEKKRRVREDWLAIAKTMMREITATSNPVINGIECGLAEGRSPANPSGKGPSDTPHAYHCVALTIPLDHVSVVVVCYYSTGTEDMAKTDAAFQTMKPQIMEFLKNWQIAPESQPQD